MVLDIERHFRNWNNYIFFVMNWFMQHLLNVFFGLIIGIIGYFTGAKNAIYVMWAIIMFDLFSGLWASLKMGRGWQSIKMWRTIYKLFFATAIVAMLYAMDREMGVKFFQFYKAVAWLISGFEMWSILENISEIVDWRIIKILKKYMHDKIENETGVDFNKN